MPLDHLVGDADPTVAAARTRLIPSTYAHIAIVYVHAIPVDPHRYRGNRYCRFRDDLTPPIVEVFQLRLPLLARSLPALFHAGIGLADLLAGLIGIGYAATEAECWDVNLQDYPNDPTVRAVVDARARDWAEQQIQMAIATDPTLGLPNRVFEYYGRRVTRHIEALTHYIDRAERDPQRYRKLHSAKQRRYQLFAAFNNGGQLSPGDVLEGLGLDRDNPSHRARLRRVARREQIGIPYSDSLGRACRLYRFGDVSLIAAAWNRRIRTCRQQSTPRPQPKLSSKGSS